MNRFKNKKAFTLAETLIVVAIIIVLAALAFIAVPKYIRSMKQLERDAIAKEIYVAAQNHLTMAESQGYPGIASDKFGNSGDAADDTGKDVYFYVVPGYDQLSASTSLSQMLPKSSIDETVRMGGSYVVRYQKSTGMMLDVFYAETSGRFAHTFQTSEYASLINNMRGESKKAARQDYNGGSIIGYYGEVDPEAMAAAAELKAPKLQIFNNELLYAELTDMNPENGNAFIVLEIRGKNSSLVINNLKTKYSSYPFITYDAISNKYTLLLDSILQPGKHFDELFGTYGFIAGEDITITARVESTVVAKLPAAVSKTANSLFASVNGTEAMISNIRHLENLDRQISNLNAGLGITSALQTSNLDWSAFTGNVYSKVGAASAAKVKVFLIGDDTGSAEGCYLPVSPDYALSYNGGGHSVSNIKVNTSGNAGMFGELKKVGETASSVSDLELVDFVVTSTGSGNAGALAGTLTDSNVTGVLVRNNKNDDDKQISAAGGNAGGLTGSMSGGTVQVSAAAVYVNAVGGNAGGLIGSASGSVSVLDSYSGGHTVNARYSDDLTGERRINVVADGSHIGGGLIGDASSATLNVKYCYSTCSVRASVAGGLIGKGAASSAGTVSNSYAVGRLSAYDSTPVGPLIGIKGGVTFSGNNYYLNNISDNVSTASYANVTGISGKDTEATFFILPEAQRQDAVTYDDTLTVEYLGKYYFPTIKQLDTALTSTAAFVARHYGDWQIPDLDTLNFRFVNGDTLHLDIDLEDETKLITIALTGGTGNVTKTFLLSYDENTNKITLSKEGHVDNDTKINYWDAGDPTTALNITGPFDNNGVKTFTILMDDITKQGTHFAELFAGTGLIPGENITVRLGKGEASWSELQSVTPVTENSLFAVVRNAQGGVTSTDIANANISSYVRHLQNLDPKVSNLDSRVATATMIGDITWDSSKYPSVYGYNSAEHTTTSFYGIYNNNLTNFNGADHTIKNLVVGGAPDTLDSVGAGNAGLFRLVDNGMKIQDLRLQNNVVTTTGGNAGLVAAQVSGNGLTIDTVLAEGLTAEATVSGSGNAGGLVGLAGADLTINNSAATVLVAAGDQAGGLLGLQSSGQLTITNSYSGGHTDGSGEYYVGSAAYSGSDRWNVISNKAAGGLVGEIGSGASAAISKTFNAASVYASGNMPAGGIIGAVNGTITNDLNLVYTVAPVAKVGLYRHFTEDNDPNGRDPELGNAGVFIGTASSEVPNGTATYYLPEIYHPDDVDRKPISSPDNSESNYKYIGSGSMANPVKLAYYSSSGNNGIAGVGDTSTLEIATETYDTTMRNREYPFSMWTEFGFESSFGRRVLYYYGDWEPVRSEPTKEYTFYFMREDPTVTGSPIVPFATASDQRRVLQIQTAPLKQSELLFPTIPYVPGFIYGKDRYDDQGHLIATDAPKYWTVYYGDQRAVLESSGITGVAAVNRSSVWYSNAYGYAALDMDDILDLHERAGNGEVEYAMTLVAHYSKSSSNKTLELRDFDPSGEIAEYVRLGQVQLAPEGERLSNLYAAGKLHIPQRNVVGYTFLGWYTKPMVWNDEAGKYVIQEGSQRIFRYDAESRKIVKDVDIYVAEDVILYANYEIIEYEIITVDFVVQTEGTVAHLNSVPRYSMDSAESQYQLQFVKGRAFNSTFVLPGKDDLEILNLTYRDKDANGYDVVPPSSEASIDKTEHTMHISTNKEQHYVVSFEGDIDDVTNAYVVRYELGHTSAIGNVTDNGDNSYTVDTTYNKAYNWTQTEIAENNNVDGGNHFYYNPYAGQEKDMNMLVMSGTNPDVKAKGITGFQTPDSDMVEYINLKDKTAAEKTAIIEKYGLGNGKIQQQTTSGGYKDYNIDIVVVMKYERKQYALTFDSTGGEYIDPEMLDFDEPIDPYLNVEPDYDDAHTFNGWTLSTGSGANETIIDNSNHDARMPMANVKAKASWIVGNVPYRVAWWYENANDDGYSYMASQSYNAQAGSTVASSTYRNTNFDGRDATHFTYQDDNCGYPTSITVKSDGSSVLNVYFKRNTYTFTFRDTQGYVFTPNNSGTYGLVEDEYVLLQTGTGWLYNGDPYTGTTYVTTTSNNETPKQYGSAGQELSRVNIPSYAWSSVNTYTANNDLTEEQRFGLIDGEYVPLTVNSVTNYTWKLPYTYTSSTNTYTGDRYAFIDGEYVLLIRGTTDYYYTENGNNIPFGGIRYRIVTGNNSGDYGVVGGQLVEIYRRGQNWYYRDGNNVEHNYGSGTRYEEYTNNNSTSYAFINGEMKQLSRSQYYGYTYWSYNDVPISWNYRNNNYGEPRYTRAANNANYTSQRYERSGSSFNPTDSIGDANYTTPLYGKDGNNNYQPLTRTGTPDYSWSYNGSAYTGQRYKQGPGAAYTGARYTRSGSSAPYTYTSTTANEPTVQYGVDANVGSDGRNGHVQINRGQLQDSYSWIETDTQQSYNGTRYVETAATSGTVYGLVNGTMVVLTRGTVYYYNNQLYTDQRYTRSNNNGTRREIHTFTAKYQQNISDKWEFNGTNGIHYPQESPVTSWKATTTYSERFSHMEIMPGVNLTMDHLTYTDRTTRYFYYYTEALPDSANEANDRIYNGKRYNLYVRLLVDFNFATEAEDFFDIAGFKQYVAKSGNNNNNYNWGAYFDNYNITRMNFYYTRNSYRLDMVNGNTTSTVSVPFEKTLESYNTTPNRPSNLTDDYKFRGWYKDPNYQTEFDFTQKMPASPLIAYAKWTRDPNDVYFHIDASAGESLNASAQTFFDDIEYGSTIEDTIAQNGELKDIYKPQKDGYTFLNWVYYTDYPTNAAKPKVFVVSHQITSELHLYPTWEKIESATDANVTIHYYIADANGNVELDANNQPVKVSYKNLQGETVTLEDKVVTAQIGSLYTTPALTAEGFYPVDSSKSKTVSADEAKNVITFLYKRVSAWSYRVNYYVRFQSFIPENVRHDWVTGTYDTAPQDLLVQSIIKTATSRFQIVSFSMPEGSWQDEYRFDHFLYDSDDDLEPDTETTDPFVIVHPAVEDAVNGAQAVASVYIVPDVDNLYMDDHYSIYDGKNQVITSETFSSSGTAHTVVPDFRNGLDKSPLTIPTEAELTLSGAKNVSVTAHYQYDQFVEDAQTHAVVPVETNNIIDAGAYALRTYLTVDVVDSSSVNHSYIIWQSDTHKDENDKDISDMFLYVNRRPVYMISRSKSAIYNAADPVIVVANGAGDVDDTTNGGYDVAEYGFIAGEGATYVFSVDSFRRMVGTSPNIFAYILNSNTKDSNYDIAKIYGELTVVDSSDKTNYSSADKHFYTVTGSAGDYRLTFLNKITSAQAEPMTNYASGAAPWKNYAAGITEIDFNGSYNTIGNYAFSGFSKLSSVSIPEITTSIGTGSFENNTMLAEITVPDKVTSIGAGAFSGCTSLATVALPSGITAINANTFKDCAALTSVPIPSAVTSIGEGAFSGCSSLATVALPSGITAINANTFKDCAALTSVPIPSAVTSIGEGAFSGCSSLATVTLPTGITAISANTFKDCAALTSITIPDTVTSIGEGAFIGSGITKVYHANGTLFTVEELTALCAASESTLAEVFPDTLDLTNN